MSELEAFLELMEKNLRKNGFPEKTVAFPLEKMYEEADKRGFSFNKVRELLQGKGIFSSLTDSRVLFAATRFEECESSAQVPKKSSDDDGVFGMDPAMLKKAQEMMERMSPKEKESILEQIRSMDPAMIQEMQKRFASMSPQEREQVLKSFEGGV